MKIITLPLFIACLSYFQAKLNAQTISARGGHAVVACSPWSSQGQAMVRGNNLYGQLGN